VKFKIFWDSGKSDRQIEFDFLLISVFYDKGCFRILKKHFLPEATAKLIIKPLKVRVLKEDSLLYYHEV